MLGICHCRCCGARDHSRIAARHEERGNWNGLGGGFPQWLGIVPAKVGSFETPLPLLRFRSFGSCLEGGPVGSPPSFLSGSHASRRAILQLQKDSKYSASRRNSTCQTSDVQRLGWVLTILAGELTLVGTSEALCKKDYGTLTLNDQVF